VYISALLVELVTYKGFVGKHLFVSSDVILFAALVFGAYSFLKYKKVSGAGVKKLTTIFPIIEILLFMVFMFLGFLEAKTYPNYVFSRFHIQFINLIPIISYGLFFLLWLETKNIINKKFQPISLALIVLGGYYLISNLNLVLAQVNSSFSYMVANSNASYEEKMSTYWGTSVFYTNRIKALTPENATVVLPPQKIFWGVTGNVGVERYFLYPRTLISGLEESLPKNIDYNYVVVSPGNELGGGNYKLWPDFKIKAKHVYFIDPISGKLISKAQDYNPAEFSDKKSWGLIQVK
jgi:hypothetical protein